MRQADYDGSHEQAGGAMRQVEGGDAAPKGEERVLAQFSIPSEPGNERLAMQQVTDAVQELALPQRTIKRLGTAVAEATMNAIEHGNQNRAELPVEIQVLASEGRLTVQIVDQGGHRPIPDVTTPDLEAKLAELDRPRGWGLFLIKNLVDEMEVGGDELHHVLRLSLHLEGAASDGQ